MITLALDASTQVGTVAVLRDRALVAEGEAVMRGEWEERLMPAVAATLGEAGCSVRDVTRVICGAGPGSFTSLRIAGAIAKGIVMGNGERVDGLFAVSSLALIVAGRSAHLEPGRWLALLDAMRGERYAALYEVGAAGACARSSGSGAFAMATLRASASGSARAPSGRARWSTRRRTRGAPRSCSTRSSRTDASRSTPGSRTTAGSPKRR